MIRVLIYVLLDILVGALLSDAFRSWSIAIELLLINMHVHLLDKEAVSGDAVTLVEQNDVANNKVLNVDGLRGAVLATEYGDFLVHDLLLEAQELLLFTPVTEGLDHGGKEDGEVDGDGLEPLLAGISHEEADDERDGGEDQEDLDVEFVELIPENLPERSHAREGLLVFSEEFLSSLDIFDVADNASLLVSRQGVDESLMPADLLKDG